MQFPVDLFVMAVVCTRAQMQRRRLCAALADDLRGGFQD